MSNGDDVLDNWEEFDEAGLQSTLENLKGLTSSQSLTSRPTEQFISSAIPNSTQTYTSFETPFSSKATPPLQQPMKLLQRSTQDSSIVVASRPSPAANPNFAKSPLDDMAATFQPVMMVLHKPEDEYQSANYTQPIVNQTVKILRRPTQSSEPRNNGMRPKQPIKTLKQREQEYAEARLRILGSAKNPEDDEQRAASAAAATAAGGAGSTNSSTPSTPTSITTPTNAFPANQPTNVGVVAPATKINSPKTQGGGPNMYNNHYQYQQQQQLQQQQQQLQLHHTQQQQHQPPTPFQQQHFHPNYQQQQQQQQQQNFFYNQPPQSPAYNNSTNNNRTFSSMPLLGHGPMGAIGQPSQYQQVAAPQSVTAAQAALQQQMKIQQQQYHHKSSQQQQHQKQQQQQQQQQTWSPVVGGSVSSSSLRQPQNESIVRLPRGPDGTVGFQTRR